MQAAHLSASCQAAVGTMNAIARAVKANAKLHARIAIAINDVDSLGRIHSSDAYAPNENGAAAATTLAAGLNARLAQISDAARGALESPAAAFAFDVRTPQGCEETAAWLEQLYGRFAAARKDRGAQLLRELSTVQAECFHGAAPGSFAEVAAAGRSVLQVTADFIQRGLYEFDFAVDNLLEPGGTQRAPVMSSDELVKFLVDGLDRFVSNISTAVGDVTGISELTASEDAKDADVSRSIADLSSRNKQLEARSGPVQQQGGRPVTYGGSSAEGLRRVLGGTKAVLESSLLLRERLDEPTPPASTTPAVEALRERFRDVAAVPTRMAKAAALLRDLTSRAPTDSELGGVFRAASLVIAAAAAVAQVVDDRKLAGGEADDDDIARMLSDSKAAVDAFRRGARALLHAGTGPSSASGPVPDGLADLAAAFVQLLHDLASELGPGDAQAVLGGGTRSFATFNPRCDREFREQWAACTGEPFAEYLVRQSRLTRLVAV
jgi:hypothetical protein